VRLSAEKCAFLTRAVRRSFAPIAIFSSVFVRATAAQLSTLNPQTENGAIWCHSVPFSAIARKSFQKQVAKSGKKWL
jgi:hypothetical protein